MASFSDFIVDDSGYQRPVVGADVYLLNADGSLAPTTSPNPTLTDGFGAYTFAAPDNVYTVEARQGGVTIARGTVTIGDPPQYIGKEGATGPSNNTRLTLADLKNAAITDKTSLYDGSLWTWTPGNFMGKADDVNIVKAEGVFLFDGAWVRQLADRVYLRNFGADPTGMTSANDALSRAYEAGRVVMGAPDEIYLFDGSGVVSPSNRKLIGNGASMKIARGATGIKLSNDKCEVADWTIIGNGGLYAVQNTGKSNKFINNDCTGNIGHFFFSSDAKHVKATGNYIDGRSADVEITTAIIAERSKHITITDNRSEDIPVGWFCQIRDGSERFTVANNNILQTQYKDTKVSIAGQTVFSFTLTDELGFTSPCFLKKIQINGLPLSTGYSIIGNGPTYMVTFSKGRVAGEAVRLVGYRGAENIQTNSGAAHGSITGNVVNGTADSGIIVHGSHITVSGNEVSNCGYVGIAVYGDQDHIAITGNNISDCAQMDDGMSSPDFPDLPSVFAGGILLSGNNVTVIQNPNDQTIVGALIAAFAGAWGFYLGGSKVGSDTATKNADTLAARASEPPPVVVTNTPDKPVQTEEARP